MVFLVRSSLRGLCLEVGSSGDDGGSFLTTIFGLAPRDLYRKTLMLLNNDSDYMGILRKTYALGEALVVAGAGVFFGLPLLVLAGAGATAVEARFMEGEADLPAGCAGAISA